MATNSENQHLSFGEFVNALHQLARDRRTGTVFLLADTQRYARIGFKQGRIAQIVYGKYKGEDALEHLRHITSGVYSFSDNVVSSSRERPLPPTDVLFQWLYDCACVKDAQGDAADVPLPGGGGSMPERDRALNVPEDIPLEMPETLREAIDAQNAVVPLAETLADVSAPPLRLSGDALYDSVTRALALHIGPVAPLVTNDYKTRLLGASSVDEIREVVSAIAEEIGDSAQAKVFTGRVMDLLTS